MKIRVGFGFDVHQLVEGRELWLGGIRLEHSKGGPAEGLRGGLRCHRPPQPGHDRGPVRRPVSI